MADRGAEAEAFSDMIEFDTFRKSVGMGLVYRGREGDFQRAKSVNFNKVANDNIHVDTPADQEALETAPTYTTATMSVEAVSRALIRGTSQYNILHAMEGPGPARLDMNLMDRLTKKMAIQLDDKVFELLTGHTYGTAATNGFKTTDVGTAFSGTNAVGVDKTFGRYKSKGTAPRTELQLLNDIVDCFGDAVVKWRGLNVMAGETVGDGMPTGFAYCAESRIVRPITTWAKREGILDMRNSMGTMAWATGGILGTAAYAGTIDGVDILTTEALRFADTATEGFGYFVPVGGCLHGGLRPMMWDFARYGQGNTGGAAVARSTVILPYYAKRSTHEGTLLGRMGLQLG